MCIALRWQSRTGLDQKQDLLKRLALQYFQRQLFHLVTTGASSLGTLMTGLIFCGGGALVALLALGPLHFWNFCTAALRTGLNFAGQYLRHFLRWLPPNFLQLQIFLSAFPVHFRACLPLKQFHFLHVCFIQRKYSLLFVFPFACCSRQRFNLGSTGTSGGLVTFGALVTSALVAA